MYKTLVDNGHGNTDHSSLYNEIERINKKWAEDLMENKLL
jgi:2-hydroxy-3-oxopropionate reductase